MSNKNAESAQVTGDAGVGTGGGVGGGGGSGAPLSPSDPTSDQRGANAVIKSGPLFLSSKGIGWTTTWKKRWFILTRTSLVFFRSDPSVVPQKGSEANLTLGGIDLNNSGSVVVKADKKLLTVLFPDGGRDGRAFTLKAETSEDLYEWKTALENALAQAPNAAPAVGQNGVMKSESESKNGSSEQTKDRQPAKSTVIGRPVLLALEEVDGTPTFLEKAMRFIEEHGVKVEGILRQAADVEHVERRIREYEQGKTDFSPDEDGHIIADCVKYIIRELPSSPVPASCCNALLDACRKSTGGDKNARINAMRVAICETFPEPNRRLLQRILQMMQVVASNKNKNLMSPSAVAACMAPLLLRPLLSGECEIENDFDVGADGSMQLLQAAAAANHAQAIVITLLEEYNKIFGEGSVSSELYSDSEESGSENEDDDESYDDDGTGDSDAYSDEDFEYGSSESEGSYSIEDDDDDDDEMDLDGSSYGSRSPEVDDDNKAHWKLSSNSLKKSVSRRDKRSSSLRKSMPRQDDAQKHGNVQDQANNSSTDRSSVLKDQNQPPIMQKSITLVNGPVRRNRRPTALGRAAGRKNLSMESIDYELDDESDIKRLEAIKVDLRNKVAEEVKRNENLQANMEKRKKVLHEYRLDLEREVAKLQDQLQKETDTRTALEAVLKNPLGPLPNLSSLDDKTKKELQELAQAESDVINLTQKVDDLGMKRTNQQREQIHSSMSEALHKLKDNEGPATHHHERSSKDSHLEGAATDNENSLNKDLPQNQHSSSSKSVIESAVGKFNQANFKKSSTRGEGGNSASSALTKLTTRLNFLKERRSQIASELQNLDKSRGSSQSGVQSSEGSDQNPEKGRGADGSQSSQHAHPRR